MRKSQCFIVIMLLAASTLANATTWAPEKVRDPISNQRIQVSQPASSGSYIYHWPGKSDQVFWPYTDENWLWFNPKSGYIAFGNDFEEINESERDTLKTWLDKEFDRKMPPESRLGLLAWAEKVYSARGMDDDFWCHFYRLMAYETTADIEISLGYVRKAIPLLAKRLESPKDPGQRIETLYLLSEYHRRLGDDEISAGYLEQLESIQVNDDLYDFKIYLLDIAKEQRDSSPSSEAQRDVEQ